MYDEKQQQKPTPAGPDVERLVALGRETVGVQTFDGPTGERISRRQDVPRILANLRWLREAMPFGFNDAPHHREAWAALQAWEAGKELPRE